MLLVGELLLVTTKETLDSVSDIVLDKFYNFELHLLIFLFSVCMCMSGCTPWHTCEAIDNSRNPVVSYCHACISAFIPVVTRGSGHLCPRHCATSWISGYLF